MMIITVVYLFTAIVLSHPETNSLFHPKISNFSKNIDLQAVTIDSTVDPPDRTEIDGVAGLGMKDGSVGAGLC